MLAAAAAEAAAAHVNGLPAQTEPTLDPRQVCGVIQRHIASHCIVLHYVAFNYTYHFTDPSGRVCGAIQRNDLLGGQLVSSAAALAPNRVPVDDSFNGIILHRTTTTIAPRQVCGAIQRNDLLSDQHVGEMAAATDALLARLDAFARRHDMYSKRARPDTPGAHRCECV